MSTIDVGPATENGTPEHLAAPRTSALTSVRERLQAARRKRVWDHEIPYTEGYVVRFRPLGEERRQEISDHRGKEKEKNLRVLLSSADVLVECCLGIFERVDGKLVSFDPTDRDAAYVDPETNEIVGTPLTFNSTRTQDLLGIEGATAVTTVQAFYPTDGDIIGASDRIIELSGFVRAEIANDLGN